MLVVEPLFDEMLECLAITDTIAHDMRGSQKRDAVGARGFFLRVLLIPHSKSVGRERIAIPGQIQGRVKIALDAIIAIANDSGLSRIDPLLSIAPRSGHGSAHLSAHIQLLVVAPVMFGGVLHVQTCVTK
jgi:hypothetical protein